MKKLTVVTGNPNKAREIEAITGLPVESVDLEILEVQSLDAAVVAREKALSAYRALNVPVIVDDTGMSIEALGGLPGALVAWFIDTIGMAGILQMMGDNPNRKASISTCIGYCDSKGVQVFEGSIEGSITTQPRGDNGFGFDAIFVPKGSQKTNAEMSAEEKNAQSTRANALAKLKEFLDRQA